MIDTVIISHHSRKEYLNNLLGSIDLPARVLVDEGSHDPWWNARRAYQSFNGGSHLLLMEDDIKLAKGFSEAVVKIITALPTTPVSLYVPRKGIMLKAKQMSVNYVWMKEGCYGQANIIPAQYVSQFLKFEEGRFSGVLSDLRLGLFYALHKIKMLCTVPSLVEHIGNRSSITHKGAFGNHVAKVFQEDVSGINWSDTRYLEEKSGTGKSWAKKNKSSCTALLYEEIDNGLYD